MPSTGFTLAGTGANIDTGQQAWVVPGNVTADDGAFATNDFVSDALSDDLFASGFDFSSVPDTATIDGLEYRYERKVITESPPATQLVTSTKIQLAEAGAVLGTAKTDLDDWTELDVVVTQGGAADKWDATLTPAIIKSATFGARLAVLWPAGVGQFEQAAVDYVQINVHYTEATGPPAGTLALMGCGR